MMKSGKVLLLNLVAVTIIGFVAFVAGATWGSAKVQREIALQKVLPQPVGETGNIVALVAQPSPNPNAPLAVVKPVPDFELTERSGKTVRLADFKGRVWIADFFYASCPGPCPMISSRLSKLQDEILKMDNVLLVSISTQPENDTVEVLRAYAEKFHASPDRWLFLTGEKTRIYSLANAGFLLTAVEQKDSKENPVIHSTKLALVDKSGNIRGFYDGDSDESAVKILHDIRRLLRE